MPHQSVVLYHMNSPAWFEMIKVALPIEKYYGAHLRLEYRHCSSTLQLTRLCVLVLLLKNDFLMNYSQR